MSSSTKKKVIKNALGITALIIMLAITTFALLLSFVGVDNNVFEMGTVKIELNNGELIFDGSDCNLEPNKTIVKDFTVSNTGTANVYYRLYLENVEGKLQNSLNFQIYEGEELLFDGIASELNQKNPCISHEILSCGETRRLKAVVCMDKLSDNRYQKGSLTFDMTVDAVQAKNNPDKAFEN